MAKQQRLSPPSTLTDIATHHATMKSSIYLYFPKANPRYGILFPFDTQNEITAKRDESLKEVGTASAFSVLAWIEARFRIDYLQRVRKRKKDDLSRACYDLYREREQQVSFSIDILDLWKANQHVPAHVIGEIRSAYNYRNWVAHGRYWQVELDRSYNFETALNLATTIETNFPLLESDTPSS